MQLTFTLGALGYFIKALFSYYLQKKQFKFIYYQDKRFQSFRNLIKCLNEINSLYKLIHANIIIYYSFALRLPVQIPIDSEKLEFDINLSEIEAKANDVKICFIELKAVLSPKSFLKIKEKYDYTNLLMEEANQSIIAFLERTSGSVSINQIRELKQSIEGLDGKFKELIGDVEEIFKTEIII